MTMKSGPAAAAAGAPRPSSGRRGEDRIYVSTGAFKTRDLGQILDVCLREGVHRLELSSGTAFSEHLLDLVRRSRGTPMRFLVHNYFPPHRIPFVLNLASTDPQALVRSRDHCRTAIALAAEVGAPFFSVHAGAAMNARPEDLGQPQTHLVHGDVRRAYELFVESVSELARAAAAAGVSLLIENHVVAPFNLIEGENRFLFASTAEDILRLMEDVGAPNLGLLLDVGHLKVTAASLGFDPRRLVERVAPFVRAFHLSDNDGKSDQNLPFGREAWFMDLLADFPEATYIIEAYRLEPPEIRACREAVLDAVQ
ncbi:MAG: sugar phosphate isomerase/epimerase [Nitrospirae bacterium]|nr:MAG: sugar phosphate isomerase/epimerase [Nitrospirota bacterium]